MVFESILSSVYNNNFEEAIVSWRKYSLERYASEKDAIQKWNTCARTLEARLVYLLLLQPNDKLSCALENYRFWLLKQKTTVSEWSELGDAPLELPNNLYVGQEDIDEDHQKLFSMANEIRNFLRSGNFDKAAELASDMLDETLEHFKREEVILTRYGYPEAENHSKYHGLLVEKIDHLRIEFQNLAKGGKESIIAFDSLITFLVNDPIVADIEFKPFFTELNYKMRA